VSEGVSVRGGYPVEQRKMRQWSLRVSAYAQRLLDGLEKLDWTESLKETQRNWIGRSEGAELVFRFHLPPAPSQGGGEAGFSKEDCVEELGASDIFGYHTTDARNWHGNIDNAREMRRKPTEAENALWEILRAKQIDNLRFRRQHLIDQFIVDFVCLEKQLIIEINGAYHQEDEQKQYD